MDSNTNKTLIDQCIKATEAWLKHVIVAYNFCPFARPVLDRGGIHYRVAKRKDISCHLETLISECRTLDQQGAIETLLIIYPADFQEFGDYLDYFALAEQLLIAQGYEGIYQLASFHPGYCFENSETDDPENYTNRSPFPMLHILREESIDQALNSFPNPEQIPLRNIAFARQLGESRLKERRLECCKMISDQNKP